MICIQNGSNQSKALFCFPGAGASPACFMALAQALERNTPVFGALPQGLDGIAAPHSTVAEAARYHAERLLREQHRGPYRLLGHSFGGWIALEVGRILVSRGEEVLPIVLIDAEAPADGRTEHVAYGVAEVYLKLIDLLEQSCGKSMQVSAMEVNESSVPELDALLLSCMKKTGLIGKHANVSGLRGMVRTFSANLNTPYAPEARYERGVVLLLPDAMDREEQTATAVSWDKHARLEDTVILPGNHMTMLQEPGASTLAIYLMEIWKNAI